MKDSVDALLNSGITIKQQIRHELPFTQTDIERMLNLPDGYLSDDFEKAIEFPKIRVRERVVNGESEVIHLDNDVRKNS